jgi:hypothetical protein
MKKIFILCLIVLMVFSTGCTSYFSNFTVPKHHLQLDEYAIFEKEGNRFTTQIKQIEGKSSSSRISEILVTIQVKNTGDKPVSLMVYPRLEDAEGNQYPGNSIFLGMLNSGGSVTGKSSIPIPTDESYDSLKKSATLNLRFQDMKPIPYEATWDIDISSL